MSNDNKVIKVVTKGGNIRFAYVRVFQPSQIMVNGKPSGEPRYSLNLLIDKSDKENIQIIADAINQAKQQGLREKWGGVLPEGYQSPVKDGDKMTEKDREKYPERIGMFCINASAKVEKQPIVVGANPNIRITDASGLKSGDYGNVALFFWPYSAGKNNGVGCTVQSIQVMRSGEQLGGGANPVADFGGTPAPSAGDDFM